MSDGGDGTIVGSDGGVEEVEEGWVRTASGGQGSFKKVISARCIHAVS